MCMRPICDQWDVEGLHISSPIHQASRYLPIRFDGQCQPLLSHSTRVEKHCTPITPPSIHSTIHRQEKKNHESSCRAIHDAVFPNIEEAATNGRQSSVLQYLGLPYRTVEGAVPASLDSECKAFSSSCSSTFRLTLTCPSSSSGSSFTFSVPCPPVIQLEHPFRQDPSLLAPLGQSVDHICGS